MSFLLGATLLVAVTSLACALPGAWVVLRGEAMLVDALGHAVLPGIALGYLLAQDPTSPLLVLGAGAAALVTVLVAERLQRTGLLAGDAPLGLVFPALFAVGVILVTSRAAHVHLDVHAVLVGDPNLAALHQAQIGGRMIGPSALYVMLAVLAVDLAVLLALHHRLTATTLDAQFARSIGIRPQRVQALLLVCVALTTTAAFHAAGAVLVVALTVVPPAAALLVSRRLPRMLALTALLAPVGAVGGFWAAYALDLPTSPAMALLDGVLLATALGVRALRGGGRRNGIGRGVLRRGR